MIIDNEEEYENDNQIISYESAFNSIETPFKLIKKKIRNNYLCTITEVRSKYFSAIESIKTNDTIYS